MMCSVCKPRYLIRYLLGLWLICLSNTSYAWCWFNCNYAKTQYPIVLAHGFSGSDTFLGIVDYWYGIESYLENKGATVYVTQVSPVNSFVQRGEALLAQLDTIRAIHGDPNLKFNLIGHSQGGLDARYVAGVRPDLVASLTTVGTPHRGFDWVPTYSSNAGLDALNSLLGGGVQLLYALLGNNNPVDMLDALQSFSPATLAQFNAHPVFGKGMPGSYCGEGEAISQTAAGPRYNFSWVGNRPVTNLYDPLDASHWFFSWLNDEASDGMVEVCNAHFGRVISNSYRMNHMDEVNQMFGLTSPWATDPKMLYLIHANRLKNLNL